MKRELKELRKEIEENHIALRVRRTDYKVPKGLQYKLNKGCQIKERKPPREWKWDKENKKDQKEVEMEMRQRKLGVHIILVSEE